MPYRTLIQRAKIVCNEDSLDMEISHLKRTFRHNGYSNLEVMICLPQKQNEKLASIDMLLYQQAVCNKISGFMPNTTYKTIHIPEKKNIHIIRPTKKNLA
jgi:hypothetical protein